MENKRSYLGCIEKAMPIGTGSFSDVYMADYYGFLCAYKEFCDPEYVEAIKNRVISLSGYNDKRYLFPFDFIYRHPKDENFEGYVMDLKSFHDSLNTINDLNIEEKVKILKMGRDLVDGLHKDYGIIHCDLAPWNFMYNKTLDELVLADFDTNIKLSDTKNAVSDKVHSNEFIEYVKNNGVDKDADIFLYNLCCYAFLNNCDFYDVLKELKSGNFGVIESSQAQKILSTYKDYNKPKSVKKEYIINYL